MNIIIGGDVVPTKVNQDLFEKGEISKIIGEALFSKWNAADARIFNLEAPLLDENYPIDKHGPVLKASEKTINGIEKLSPTLVTLANNHILDHGTKGLKSTLKLLEKSNIPYLGVGENKKTASKGYIIEYDNCKVGVYACAEQEFSGAGETTAGANTFDLFESFDHIEELKKKCDHLIVIYHGGKEHYRYPSPYLRKVCRKIVRSGANLVICQHSHCIGSAEDYLDSKIIYGQGNFIFNKHNNEFWNSGLLLKLTIGKSINIEYIPIMTSDVGIELAEGEDADKILQGFHNRTEEIKKEGFLERKYEEFAEENIDNYLRHFIRFGKWFSRVDRYIFKGRIVKRLYSKRYLLGIQNFIQCEAHRELIINGLQNKNM